MQILWISHFLLFPETGYGGLQRSRNLLKVLSKYHDIHLICFYRNNDKIFVPDLKLAEKDLNNYCKNVYIIPHELSNTQKAYRLLKSVVSRTPYSAYIYRSRQLLQESNQRPPDVEHSQLPFRPCGSGRRLCLPDGENDV